MKFIRSPRMQPYFPHLCTRRQSPTAQCQARKTRKDVSLLKNPAVHANYNILIKQTPFSTPQTPTNAPKIPQPAYLSIRPSPTLLLADTNKAIIFALYISRKYLNTKFHACKRHDIAKPSAAIWITVLNPVKAWSVLRATHFPTRDCPTKASVLAAGGGRSS